MSISETSPTPRRRGRRPNAEKAAAASAKYDAEDAELLRAANAKAEELLARARRTFEDMWPFLDVSIELNDKGQLSARASFGRVHVTSLGINAPQLERQIRSWARYQCGIPERKEEIAAWARGNPDREGWMDFASIPNLNLETLSRNHNG